MSSKTHSVSSDPDSKVLFRVPYDDGTEDAEVEALWAWNLGDDRYKLDNYPYFAYSVSWRDIVYAPFDTDEGFPTFQKVLEKSGNKTIRLIFDEPYEDGNSTAATIRTLVALGCEYEGANSKFFCINIPAQSDFDAITEFLIKHSIQFEFSDPTYAELYPED